MVVTPALWARPIESLAPDIRAGRVAPVTLREGVLDRIKRVDGKLKSFIRVSATALEQAKVAAAEIKAGRWRGPLHGIPIGVKDNYLTRDMPTTVGSTAPRLRFPMRDSAPGARLRPAGGGLLGKTRTHVVAGGDVPS